MVDRQEVEVADPWQRLEADFARVLGEIPKPEGPELNEPFGNAEELEAGE